jgi:hypothetical protein
VEKAGEETDGEMSSRPCRGADPEGSMAAAPAAAGSTVLWVGARVWEASTGRPESRTATGWRRSEAGSGRGENAASRAERVTHLFICNYTTISMLIFLVSLLLFIQVGNPLGNYIINFKIIK